MNFKIQKIQFLYLASLTLAIGIMQVMTPIFLRTLIDGVLPSKDGLAIAHVLMIIGMNELLLVAGNSLLNRELDLIEDLKIQELRKWMILEVSKLTSKLVNPSAFYQSWSVDSRRLVFKKVKNIWFRVKDFIVLSLLSFICMNISFLAGILIIGISTLTFIIVSHYSQRQGAGAKQLHALSVKEKMMFDEFIDSTQSLQLKTMKIDPLLMVVTEMDEIQSNFSKERTRYQDINNAVRFVMMFSILGIGGQLFATDKLSMGSLWALLITMYRITPPLQSLVKWILQTKGDENLEERILDNMKAKEGFKKPAYYNRMVKILEKAIKTPSRIIVQTESTIKNSELLDALELWRSFYSKKQEVEICHEWPLEIKSGILYMMVSEPKLPLPESCVVFTDQKKLASEIEASAEILTLSL
jgi:ABC-type bacteriocin/lantibiotic exporter with double-glycine peptidase domain